MVDEIWGVDITPFLREFVTMELNDSNPMKHTESFSLMESMSAIEVKTFF